MSLNELQTLAFDSCIEGKNVLITGAGGVGKSFVINQIRNAFADRGRSFAVTASTGAAAVLIDGVTLHRWAGIGLATFPAERLARDIMYGSQFEGKRHWEKTNSLIIDEISMIDAELLDKLDYIAKAVRQQPYKPFGGMQVILCGDFAQLPPVKAKGGFAFEAKCWGSLIERKIELTQIVRQSEEQFRVALNEVRFANLSPETTLLLRSRVNANVGNKLIRPTRLLSKREDVKKVNEERLFSLEGEVIQYDAIDKYDQSSDPISDEDRIKMNKDMQAREHVRLKVGAQVMLIYNHSNELVNGSRGVVTAFQGGLPKVRFLNGTEMVIQRHVWRVKISDGHTFVRVQIPLILAWACTIHKIQGASLDCIDIDISNAFEYGQAYVALSRVRMLDGLRLRNGDLSRIIAHQKVKAFYGQK